MARQAVTAAAHAQPHSAFGTGERDIQQAHVFIHIGLGDVGLLPFFLFSLDSFFGIIFGWFFETAEERHKHQGVLQPFALVVGHDLHALVIGFKAHFLRFGAVAAGLQPLGQMLQQSGRALQSLAGVLQQFAQMQQVGQAALAVRQSQQAGRNVLFVQPAVEHGQHALLMPLL